MKKFIIGFFMLVVLSLTSTSALAGSGESYIGLTLGPTDFDICGSFGTCNDSDTGFKIFAGSGINENFDIEVSYFNLGSANYGWFGTKINFDVTGIAVDGVAKLPVGDQVEVFGKAGLALWGVNSFIFGGGGGLDLKLGLGAKFKVNERLSLRAEYELYALDGDATMLGVGIEYGF